MKQTYDNYKQPITMENPLQCSCHRFLASFVKEIMLPFSKLKSWLKTQPIICKFLITSARGRCTKVREAYDANNASSMSKVSSTNYLKTVSLNHLYMYTYVFLLG